MAGPEHVPSVSIRARRYVQGRGMVSGEVSRPLGDLGELRLNKTSHSVSSSKTIAEEIPSSTIFLGAFMCARQEPIPRFLASPILVSVERKSLVRHCRAIDALDYFQLECTEGSCEHREGL